MSQMINKFLPPFLFWFASFGLAHGQIRVEATFDPKTLPQQIQRFIRLLFTVLSKVHLVLCHLLMG